jgi:hypothetical protein
MLIVKYVSLSQIIHSHNETVKTNVDLDDDIVLWEIRRLTGSKNVTDSSLDSLQIDENRCQIMPKKFLL